MATSKGLQSTYLRNVCSDLNYFCGIFASDELTINYDEIMKKKRFSLICNLSPASEEGSHYITIIRDSNNLYYLDSFGHDTSQIHITNFLKKASLTTFFLSTQIQDYTSLFCGFFCVMFCYLYDSYGGSFMTKAKFHSDDLKKNDELCLKYIIKLCEKRNTKSQAEDE